MQCNRKNLTAACFRRTTMSLAIAAAFGMPALHAAPAPGAPVGQEFQVNTWETGSKTYPAAAMDANGNFVVAWVSYDQDGDDTGVYAQRYDAAGVPAGDEFRVNTWTAGRQFFPSVAMNADGDFVVTWQSYGQDGDGPGVFAQRYSAAGQPQGDEFQVNTVATGWQTNPAVAMDADGNFTVVWVNWHYHSSTWGLAAQRFDAAGLAQGEEFRVAVPVAGFTQHPAMAMDSAGNFVVAWMDQHNNPDGGALPPDVFARRFDASGETNGSLFRVNTSTTGSQGHPTVAMDREGSFVVAWESVFTGYPDSDGAYAQRYDAAGLPQGDEFKANTGSSHGGLNNRQTRAAMSASGDFVLVWPGALFEGGQGIVAQRYDADGMPLGQNVVISTSTVGGLASPTVAMDADGDFVAAWSTLNAISAQRFAGPEPVDLSLALNASPEHVALEQALDYDILVTNQHPGSLTQGVGVATGIVTAIDLPEGASFDGFSGSDWHCDGPGPVSCAYGAVLPPGGVTPLLSLNLTAPASHGEVPGSAFVDGNQFDPDFGNNSDDTSTRVGEFPDPFTFRTKRGVESGTNTRSETVTIAGLNGPAPITLGGDPSGRYLINGVGFFNQPGTINNGDTLQLRLTAGAIGGPAGEVSMSVTVGGYTTPFTVRAAVDNTPDAFDFPDRNNQPLDVNRPSAVLTPEGYNVPLRASVSGHSSCRLRIDDGDWQRRGTIEPGQSLQLRLRTADTPATTRNCSVAMGGVEDEWSVTTAK
jgi:hypothetical protein